jgi:SsrA-binding protein
LWDGDPPIMGKKPQTKIIAKNKKAYFNYELLESFEAGISLFGSEVKSIREGRISLKESYAEVKDGEVFLLHCHISPYEAANRFNHEPRRERKLLLHKQEIKRLTGKIKEKGLTLVPTKVLINAKGKVKVEISLAKGKRTYQKKEVIKERDIQREVRTELKKWR